MTEQPVLSARKIVKRFQENVVLREVDLDLWPGRMLGLVGANGAGKSTLVKIFCGALAADGGTLLLDGQPHVFRSVVEALAVGIAVAHQQVSIIPCLTGAENVVLGREPCRGGLIDGQASVRAARDLACRFGVEIDLSRPCSELSLGEQKILDILKALAREPRVLILDEPTASLTLAESRQLFAFLRDLRQHGHAVLFISHHLREVAEECDHVAVLKDGRKVYDGLARDLSVAEMARLMVDRATENSGWDSHARAGERAIVAESLSVGGLSVPELTVARGEVVGVAGVVGAGQTQLIERLAGVSHPARARRVEIGTLARLPRSVAEAVAHHIFLIPDNRAVKAMLNGLSVADNLACGSLAKLSRFGLMQSERIIALSRDLIARLAIACSSPGQTVSELSGGNQQKVAFGRWLARAREAGEVAQSVFLLDNPTEGVDIATKVEIYKLIGAFAAAGAAVLVSSTDFAELALLCDRVYCIRHGAVVTTIGRNELSEDRLMIEVS